MKEQIAEAVNNAAQNPKVGAVIVATVAGSGTSTILELMPVLLGFVTNVVAITSALIFIFINIRQHKIKMAILEKELRK